MAADKNAASAVLPFDQALALYREARDKVREVEVELKEAETLGAPPTEFRDRLAEQKATLALQQAALVRAQNDQLRTTGRGGRVLITSVVAAMGNEFVAAAEERVRAFAAFTSDNDPHDEHDFGALDVAGVRLLFKMDYYDADERHGSSDPADPDMTSRVLTILLPEEY